MSDQKVNWSDNDEIKLFQEYLRIPSVHPNIDYAPCVDFLQKQAASLDLLINIYYPHAQTMPVVVITWLGIDPNQSSIMLNSHMDVVPAFKDYWSHPPFGAEIDSDGRIYARGAQDMKCVGAQYLAAVRALKRDNVQLKRTIHIVFVPDEEQGGFLGMAKFVLSDNFKALNVGFCLDEGMASETDCFPVFYGERFTWHVIFKYVGTSGHASLIHENVAIEKVRYLLDKLLTFGENEKQKLKINPDFTVADITTINLTMLNGGVQLNLVPPDFTLAFDMRLALDFNSIKFEQDIRKWCEEAGGNIAINYVAKSPRVEPTKLDETNLYWVAFKNVLEHDLKLKIKPQIFPAATDSRYLRNENIPVIGFSPMNNTPVLLHEHDEYLKASTYIEGVEIYKKILIKIANV